MSASTSNSTAKPPTNPIPLLARGILSIFDLWPALRLAVSEQWGGPDSASKQLWMASELVDHIENCMPKVKSQSQQQSSSSSQQAQQVDSDMTELEGAADEDDLTEMLYNMISDEFDTDLEDSSPEQVSKNIVKLWRLILKGDLSMLEQLEEMAGSKKGKKVVAKREGGEDGDVDEEGNPIIEEEDEDEDWESGDEDEMDVDNGEEAPKLVERKKEPEEPVVDEDGFTLVKGKGKKGR